MSDYLPVSESLRGFIAKDGKVLKATLVGANPSTMRTVVLYEEDNAIGVSDELIFFTQKFAAEIAAAES